MLPLVESLTLMPSQTWITVDDATGPRTHL
jgi:hypothetical protein